MTCAATPAGQILRQRARHLFADPTAIGDALGARRTLRGGVSVAAGPCPCPCALEISVLGSRHPPVAPPSAAAYEVIAGDKHRLGSSMLVRIIDLGPFDIRAIENDNRFNIEVPAERPSQLFARQGQQLAARRGLRIQLVLAYPLAGVRGRRHVLAQAAGEALVACIRQVQVGRLPGNQCSTLHSASAPCPEDTSRKDKQGGFVEAALPREKRAKPLNSGRRLSRP